VIVTEVVGEGRWAMNIKWMEQMNGITSPPCRIENTIGESSVTSNSLNSEQS